MSKKVFIVLLLTFAVFAMNFAYAQAPGGCTGMKQTDGKSCAKACGKAGAAGCSMKAGGVDVPHDNVVWGNAKQEADGKNYFNDPVCGMKQELGAKGNFTSFNEKRYFFCSADCKTKFEKDPKSFLKPTVKATDKVAPTEKKLDNK